MRMRYCSGVSLWRALAPDEPAAPALDGDAACEVLMIGGGVSGALARNWQS
jgi:hypothetical protein